MWFKATFFFFKLMADRDTSLLKTDQMYLQFYVLALYSLTVTPWTKGVTAVFSLIVLHRYEETLHSNIQRNRFMA